MKIMYKGDSLVKTIVGTKSAEPGTVYRFSDYAVSHLFNQDRYLYNNFTKMLVCLEDSDVTVNPKVRFSSDDVAADPDLQMLVKNRFLVAEDTNETEIYENFCRIARMLKEKKNGYQAFTILPTTACNARCVYCYEQGIEYVTMNDATVRQTIAFIKENRNPNAPVRLAWFGGEPLIGERFIDAVSASLRNDGIEFSARITTNGSLITKEIVEKMRTDWNITDIQITLDGIEEEYNRRKNYYFNYDSAYWHVLSRIKMVNEGGIRLNVRVNIDEGNVDGVPQMIEELKDFVPNRDLVHVDLVPLFDLQEGEGGFAIWDKSFKLAEWIAEQGFAASRHFSTSKAKYHFCMADSPYRAIVIAPDGKLYNCENIMALSSVGDVWNGITDAAYLDGLAVVEPAREQCKGCLFLPECTTFSRCANPKVDCRYAAQKRMERALDRMISLLLEQGALSDEDEDEE